tara:strand:+ start:36587 stop:37495 length:909 start_codon:yes stop_codon:yes gene_type:complete
MSQLFLILFTCLLLTSNAQNWDVLQYHGGWELDQSYTLDTRRRNILLISEASAYTIALVGLNELWYANYPKSSFHFINDNEEWMQMDKIGHMATSYYTGVLGIKAYQWTGMNRNNSIWYGGMTGSFFLLIIEILDGHSKEWGASAGDLIANTCGSFLAIGQALKWDEQKIQLKYSYSPSKWANKNPQQLGSNHLERVLKDYNGQTYWLSFNLKSLIQIENENFPSWLSFSIGYGADFMLNPYPSDKNYPKRQFLLSFDVDLNRIKTRNRILNSIFHTFGFLKFPTPAIQYRNGNVLFHSIYY